MVRATTGSTAGSIADSIEIVKGFRHYYEDYHQVTISDEMCAAAVTIDSIM